MIKCNLDSPSLPITHEIYKILRLLEPRYSYTVRPYFWGPEFFCLDKSEIYQNMDLIDQRLVLSKLSDSLLHEAYFVEKAGIAFALKMAVLSETLQERQLYSHFAHEESNHLSMIEKFLLNIPSFKDSTFLNLLIDLIESGDKNCLTYFIQIILEGFGLRHYQNLKVGCLEPSLIEAINHILIDEARHYRSGITLFDPNTLTETQRLWIGTATLRMRNYFTLGPIRVINAILEVTGKIHQNDYNQLLLDIDAKGQTDGSLALLESLCKTL